MEIVVRRTEIKGNVGDCDEEEDRHEGSYASAMTAITAVMMRERQRGW